MPLRSLRTLGLLPIAVLAIGFIGLIAAIIFLNSELRELDRKSQTLFKATLELERSIGYGGFIHAFKNDVLRGDVQPEYAVQARESFERAIDALDRIERIAAELGIAPELSATRDTLSRYHAMLDVIREMHGKGVAAASIDNQVRLPDEAALSDVRRVHVLVADELDNRNRRLLLIMQVSEAALVLMIVGVALTMYRRRQTERRLQQAQAHTSDLEMLIGITAHDLRVPVRHIDLLVDQLATDLKETDANLPASIHETIEDIQNRTVRVQALCTETIAFMRAGMGVTPVGRVNLRDLTDKITRNLPDPSIVEFHGPHEEMTTRAADLEIVLRNLISNAVKHGGRSDIRVIVRANRVGGATRIEVEDNGQGIPPQYRDRVFRLFSTLEANTNDAEVSGVGLAMVHRIVRSLDGSVDIGEAEPSGAIFIISLPDLTPPPA